MDNGRRRDKPTRAELSDPRSGVSPFRFETSERQKGLVGSTVDAQNMAVDLITARPAVMNQRSLERLGVPYW